MSRKKLYFTEQDAVKAQKQAQARYYERNREKYSKRSLERYYNNKKNRLLSVVEDNVVVDVTSKNDNSKKLENNIVVSSNSNDISINAIENGDRPFELKGL